MRQIVRRVPAVACTISLMFCFMFGFAAQVVAANPIILQAIADVTFNYSTNAVSNSASGWTNWSEVDAVDTLQTLLKFDLAGVVGNIESATLQIKVAGCSALYINGSYLQLNASGWADSTWSEASTALPSVPGYVPLTTSPTLVDSSRNGYWIEVPLMQDAPFFNSRGPVTIVLASQGPYQALFYTREGGTAARLNITYFTPDITDVRVNGTSRLGQALAGEYTYNAAGSGDEGTSIYRWYRSDDSNGSNHVLIPGANLVSYVLQESDIGEWISFEVTPVAANGIKGTPVESAKVGPTEKTLQDSIAYSATATTYGDAPFVHTASGGSGTGALSYTSSNATVAAINSDGLVTILKAGTTTLMATKAGDGTYAEASQPCTLTVNPATLTATVGDYSKIYGEEDQAFAVEVIGFVHGETAVTAAGYSSPTASSPATITTNVGLVTTCVSGGSAVNYTFDTSDTGILTISPKSLTSTAVANNKTRDGTTAATGTINLSGVMEGDDVTASGTIAFVDANAGAGKTVNVTDITLVGAQVGNYTLDNSSTTVLATIDPAPLTIKADGKSKTYGNADPEFTVAYIGLVPGDDASVVSNLSISREAGENVKVGGYTITPSGAAVRNYILSYETGIFTIEPRPIAASSITVGNKTYDGDISAVLNVTGATPEGKVGDDDVTLSTTGVSGTFDNKNVGAGKTVTIAGLGLDGADVGNYSLQPYSTDASITRKLVNAVGITAYHKYYDGTTKASLRTSEAGLSGVLAGDDVALDVTNAIGTFADSHIGSRRTVMVTRLALTGADAENYVLATYTTLADIIEEVEATLPTPSTEPPTPSAEDSTGAEITINGETQEGAATAITTTEGEKTVTTIILDSDKLSEELEQAGENPLVIISANTVANMMVQLTGQMVKEMELHSAVLEIRTGRSSYNLPAQEINIDAVAEQLGEDVSLQDVTVHVQIAEPEADAVQIIEDTANQGNYILVVPPLEFSITCTHGGQTVEVSRFNHYLERTVAVPTDVDPARITTGIVVLSDGSFSHVPTTVAVIGGKYYVKINSLTNSTYSVIWHEVDYPDMVGHWARQSVNAIASRLVMEGESDQAFGPDRAITRGEFVATIVKALGLQPGVGENSFIDIEPGDESAGYIVTARTYGVMNGYADGTFRSENTITREEAMSMITAAMRLTGLQSGLQPGESAALLTTYADGQQVGNWARNVVAACLKSGIVGGRPGMVIAPKDNISRAETAAIMQRLLRKSGLI